MSKSEEWEKFSAYRPMIEDAKRVERERIIAILKTIRVGDHWIGRDYAIELIRGENK